MENIPKKFEFNLENESDERKNKIEGSIDGIINKEGKNIIDEEDPKDISQIAYFLLGLLYQKIYMLDCKIAGMKEDEVNEDVMKKYLAKRAHYSAIIQTMEKKFKDAGIDIEQFSDNKLISKEPQVQQPAQHVQTQSAIPSYGNAPQTRASVPQVQSPSTNSNQQIQHCYQLERADEYTYLFCQDQIKQYCDEGVEYITDGKKVYNIKGYKEAVDNKDEKINELLDKFSLRLPNENENLTDYLTELGIEDKELDEIIEEIDKEIASTDTEKEEQIEENQEEKENEEQKEEQEEENEEENTNDENVNQDDLPKWAIAANKILKYAGTELTEEELEKELGLEQEDFDFVVEQLKKRYILVNGYDVGEFVVNQNSKTLINHCIEPYAEIAEEDEYAKGHFLEIAQKIVESHQGESVKQEIIEEEIKEELGFYETLSATMIDELKKNKIIVSKGEDYKIITEKAFSKKDLSIYGGEKGKGKKSIAEMAKEAIKNTFPPMRQGDITSVIDNENEKTNNKQGSLDEKD